MRSPEDSRLLARSGPAGLAVLTNQRFELRPHLELIDRTIVEAIWEAHERPQSQAEIIIVSAPPRHGKSMLVSEYLPAWFLGTFPSMRVMLASYDSDLAASSGARARDLLAEHGPSLYGVRVDDYARATARWELDGQSGGMVSVGVGGALTGRGAHLMVIDDPIKGAEQAMSPTMREKHWQWWPSTARTRLEPGAVAVVVMARWHEDDLAGRLLRESRKGGDQVHELRLPALAGSEDPLGREPGEALWPERYSVEWLEQTKRVSGPVHFEGLYQGRPSAQGNGDFQLSNFRYFTLDGEAAVLRDPDGRTRTVLASECRKIQAVDLAVSTSQAADYTVMAEIWVTKEADVLIRSVVRARVAVPDQPDFFMRHHAGCPVLFEAIGYQAGIVQTMLRCGFPAQAVHPDGDKVTRAAVAGVLYRNGKVFHLKGAPWLEDFEAELLAFPAGAHDDQVDAIAYAAKALPNYLPAPPWRPSGGSGGTIFGGILTQPL